MNLLNIEAKHIYKQNLSKKQLTQDLIQVLTNQMQDRSCKAQKNSSANHRAVGSNILFRD